MGKLLTTAAVIVFIAMIIDIAMVYHQATVGKLPWKLKLFPDIGGYL